VIIDSGGGYHCYWLLADSLILNDESVRQDAQRLQEDWMRFTKADPGAKDLARILRVPGSRNSKYRDEPVVKIAYCDLTQRYTRSQVETVIQTGEGGIRSVKKSLVRNPTAIRNPAVYGEKAVSEELQKVREALLHHRNNTLNAAAFAIGQLVDPCGLSRSEVESELQAAGELTGLPSDEVARTIRSGLEAGMQNPRRIDVENPVHSSPTCIPHKGSYSARELLQADFPSPVWTVDSMLPAGLTYLTGNPKIGKSWFALDLAASVGSNRLFLNNPVKPGRVVYYALEDNARRMRDRMTRQGWSSDASVIFHFGPPAGDAVSEITQLIKTELPRLVIIDTFSRMFKVKQNEIETITATLAPIQAAALAHGCTVLIVDHHRKQNTDGDGDMIDRVLGSRAKTAVADTLWILHSKRFSASAIATATLCITGRDVEEQKIRVAFNKDAGAWTLAQDEGAQNFTASEQAILDELRKAGGRATATQLSKGFSKDRYKSLSDVSNMSKSLKKLESAGYVEGEERTGHEQYYRLVEAKEAPSGEPDKTCSDLEVPDDLWDCFEDQDA
jgi:DNA-binding transcriptional ArsR family regulator